MYTANTMSSSFEALGMSLMYSSTMANPDQEKVDSAAESARVLVEAVKKDLKPRDIITKKSIENAVALIMATGGSTNAVLHFLAIAHAAEVEWTIDDFERMRKKVPVICDLKPSGQYVADRPAQGRRHPASAADPARRGPAARRLHHDHGPHDRRRTEGRAKQAARGPEGDLPDRPGALRRKATSRS